MRLVFFGTPQMAVPTLQRIADAGHEVCAVVTQPDRPSGRGRKLTPSPVKQLALERGFPVLQPERVRTPEFLAKFAALNAEIAVVVAFGQILPQALLDAPKHGCLNVHFSLLPKYRGAAPLQWAIVNGETVSGVTIMQMDAGLDTGPIVAVREVDILEDDDAVSLGNMLSLLGAELMEETLAGIAAAGRVDSVPQDHAAATKAPLIKREMAKIDWSQPAEKVICAIRGFQPWPKAYTTLPDGKELKIVGAEAVDPAWLAEGAFAEGVAPGTVIEVLKSRGPVVRCGGDRTALLITRAMPESRGEVTGVDLVNGGVLDAGRVLGR